ncbi:hypothetical protein [Clostridium sp. USBA 49]|uniref:hypothetical protein n=1 Tax=Clostridium sp. USBA 49 TaxID=1881060 RepID=UPI001178C161|nr:hypothetical protein [Clostridium sp. USBA 49]
MYKLCLKYNFFQFRSSEDWQKLYNQLTSIERCNLTLKEYINVNNLCSAGIRKAKVVSLLNCIALVAGTIAVNQKSNDLNLKQAE